MLERVVKDKMVYNHGQKLDKQRQEQCITGMICQIPYGTKLRTDFLGVRGIQEDQHMITGGLSMQYYGYSELELPGEIYRQTMEIGRIHTGDSVGGEIRGYGRRYLR
jgi:hypothetical protein